MCHILKHSLEEQHNLFNVNNNNIFAVCIHERKNRSMKGRTALSYLTNGWLICHILKHSLEEQHNLFNVHNNNILAVCIHAEGAMFRLLEEEPKWQAFLSYSLSSVEE